MGGVKKMGNEKQAHKKGKMTEDEFKKLPPQEQAKIIKARQERFKELEKVAQQSINDIASNSVSEREYHAKFNKVYNYVRKGLVILKARKITGSETGKDLYDSTLALLNHAQEL